jgi:hypothetical protein
MNSYMYKSDVMQLFSTLAEELKLHRMEDSRIGKQD